jgi:Tfp pilus assembly protein PilX
VATPSRNDAARAVNDCQEVSMSMYSKASTAPYALALAAFLTIGTAACGGPSEPAPQAAAPAPAAEPAAAEPAPEASPAADVDAREKELAAREAELALREKEQELARREAELAAREAAAKAPAKTTSTAKPASSTSTQGTKAVAATPPPAPVTVPAGTQLPVELAAPISTRTASVGDPVEARLVSDLVVDGRRVARAGASVRGSVTEVVSGSQKIGTTPTLAIAFRQLALADGTTAAIDGQVAQQGKSEKGQDTAKIVGGAAAGAIIGHQIDDDKGSVIGGILGGAAGTAAAKKTGTEVSFAEGDTVSVALRASFEYKGK